MKLKNLEDFKIKKSKIQIFGKRFVKQIERGMVITGKNICENIGERR